MASLAAVAAVTLVPTGTGWAWGSPLVELRWYVTGLGSEATLIQLVGNVSLLVVPAALVVLLWPSLGRAGRLGALALMAGATIELLQWALPLGRVVSPSTPASTPSAPCSPDWPPATCTAPRSESPGGVAQRSAAVSPVDRMRGQGRGAGPPPASPAPRTTIHRTTG